MSVQFGPGPSGEWWVSIPGEKNLGPFIPAVAIRTAKQIAAVNGGAAVKVEFGAISATGEGTKAEPEAAPEAAAPAAKKARAKKTEAPPAPPAEPVDAPPAEPEA